MADVDAGIVRGGFTPSQRACSPFVSGALFFLACGVPHFVISLPGGGDMARSTDFVAAACLALYAFVRTSAASRITSQEFLLLFFLFGTTMVSVAFYMIAFFVPAWVARVGLEQMLYVLRHIFLFSPALLALALQTERRKMARWGLMIFALAAVFIIFMTVMYSRSRWFQANQSITLSFGGLNMAYYKRMGGLVGESGAYGFHAMFVWYGLIFFAYLSRLNRLAVILLIATPVWLAFVYVPSQTRIILPACAVFLLAMSLQRPIMRPTTAAFVIAGFCAAFAAIIASSMMGGWNLPFGGAAFTRLSALASGGMDADGVTSGRLSHWAEIMPWVLQNPLFGYGYRSTRFLVMVATENVFIQGMMEYGLILFSVMCLWIIRLWISVGRTGRERPELAPAAATLRAIMLAAFVQWQFNDINTYYQTFPMLLAIIAMFTTLREERVRDAG